MTRPPAEDPVAVLRELAARAGQALTSLREGRSRTGLTALQTIQHRAADVARHHYEDRSLVPTLNPDQKATLLEHADKVADILATEWGRSRVGAPTYCADDDDRGFWSALVVGMADDVEMTRVRVFIDGSREGEMPPEETGAEVSLSRLRAALEAATADPPPGYDVERRGDYWEIWRHVPDRNGPRKLITTRATRKAAIQAAVADDERRDALTEVS